MQLVTGEERGLQLSDLGPGTFNISDLWALVNSLTFLCAGMVGSEASKESRKHKREVSKKV